jgi:hypothetical protein
VRIGACSRMQQPYSDLELALGRALTEAISPEEAPYFDDIVAAESKPQRKRGDHELGFGVPTEALPTISAAILVLCKPILEFVWENALDAAGKVVKDATDAARSEFERRVFAWVKRRFSKPSPISSTPERLQAFIAAMRKDAAEAGLDQEATDRLMATLLEGFEN